MFLACFSNRSRLHSGLKLFVLAQLVLAAGCSESTSEKIDELPEIPFEGQQIQIAIPAGLGLANAWQIDLDEWTAQTRATWNLVDYDPSDQQKPLAEGLGFGSGAQGQGATLFVFPITRVAELVEQDLLAEIPVESLRWGDLFPGLREGPGSIAGRPGVVPISSPVLLCYYRHDLFESEQLSPPETWDDYQKLLQKLGERGLRAVEPWNEQFRATMFLSRAVAYAKHPNQFSLFFDIRSGEPLIDGPGFVRALEESRAAIDQMNSRGNVTGYSPLECRRDFFTGKAAMAICYETGNAEPAAERPASMTVGFVRLPGQPDAYNRSTRQWEPPPNGEINRCTLTAFSGLGVGVSKRATAPQQQAAWHLLSQIAVEPERLIRLFPAATRSLCRTTQLARPEAWTGDDLTSGESRQYVDVLAASLRDSRLVAELSVLGRAKFRRSLSTGIGKVLSGTADPQQALRAVAQEWREIAAEIGETKVLNSYRRSLGLSPLLED